MATTLGSVSNNGHRAKRTVSSWPVIGPVLDLFNSVWFGIFLMLLIFIYCSIASAGILYPISWNIMDSDNWVRFLARGAFDKTEMEVFNWWPFNVLIALFCLNLIVVTLRRIRFNAINLGVWMIHTGIIVLAIGSVYYFSTKIEGDTIVFRRKALITVPQINQTGELIIRPGSQLVLGTGKDRYQFEVADVILDWPLLSGEDKGKRVYQASILCTTPEQGFVRQLHDGFPQYTEDVIPGSGRAIKAIGKALVDEQIKIELAPVPQDRIFLMNSGAFYARHEGTTDWSHRALPGLPHYKERIASREDVWWDGATLKPIDLKTAPESQVDPLGDYDVRVTGFLPYAEITPRWVEGGQQLNPVIEVTIESGAEKQDFELAAFDPSSNSLGNGKLNFTWVHDAAEIDKLLDVTPDRLAIFVPDGEIKSEVELPSEMQENPEFVEIPGSRYSYRVMNIIRDMPAISEAMRGKVIDVAMVEIKTPEKTFTRMVANPKSATRDMSADHAMQETDPGIEMEFKPGGTGAGRNGVTIVAGASESGLELLMPGAEPERRRQKIEIGAPAVVGPEVTLTVNSYRVRAVQEVRPLVVPVELRQANAEQHFSMIKVELSKGTWSRSLWLPFNDHAFPNEQYAVPGRTLFRPEHVQLADGRLVELMFSRESYPLPSPVILDDFELLTHVGGFTGNTQTVRDFVSRVQFAIPGSTQGWTDRMKVASNNPANFEGYWFFQSTWDPPGQRSAGMNYTGLGVGNRNGVHIQLAGTIISVIGMIYAFYFKPILIRRRRESAKAEAAERAMRREEAGIKRPEEVLV